VGPLTSLGNVVDISDVKADSLPSRRSIQIGLGVALYAGAAGIGWVWTEPPAAAYWVLLVAPSFLLGFLVGSWWALIAPAAVALLLLGVFDTRLENTGTTWGEAFVMAIAVPSALLVGFGVAWRRDRNRTRGMA
jgi:hypothetical protein